MQVTELTPDQLDELRQSYNYTLNDSTAYVTAEDIPDAVLFEAFNGFDFVPDDFTAHDEELNHFWEITNAPDQLPALPMEIAI